MLPAVFSWAGPNAKGFKVMREKMSLKVATSFASCLMRDETAMNTSDLLLLGSHPPPFKNTNCNN